MYNYLLNTDSNNPGIFRVIIIHKKEETRIFIPGIQINPLNPDGTLNEAVYQANKLTYPVALWCSKKMDEIAPEIAIPGWIVYEAGDVKRPIIIGYHGKGLDMADAWSGGAGTSEEGAGGSSGAGSSSSSSGGYSTDGSGDWITGWTCTIYGHTAGDDNGICGWNGLNYHNISGCHVAIPMSCILGSDSNFPEFSGKYGTVLEVRNPKNGKTVVAVVADCGNFGPNGKYNNTTALDLPPNTQNALNIHDNQAIEYRVIGHINSWNGEQLKLEDFITANENNSSVVGSGETRKISNTCPAANVYSLKRDGNSNVSNNFKVREFACKDESDEILIVPELVTLLEKIKSKCGGATITINSAYRHKTYNESIGGAPSSQHMYGSAADIVVSGYTSTQVYNIFRQIMPNSGGGGIYDEFTHVDVRYKKSDW